jgi:hypothetical protein
VKRRPTVVNLAAQSAGNVESPDGASLVQATLAGIAPARRPVPPSLSIGFDEKRGERYGKK